MAHLTFDWSTHVMSMFVFLCWCVALTLPSRTKLCHVLAAILSVQAISEGLTAFSRTVANPTHRVDLLRHQPVRNRRESGAAMRRAFAFS
jgi:hypothetical protein